MNQINKGNDPRAALGEALDAILSTNPNDALAQAVKDALPRLSTEQAEQILKLLDAEQSGDKVRIRKEELSLAALLNAEHSGAEVREPGSGQICRHTRTVALPGGGRIAAIDYESLKQLAMDNNITLDVVLKRIESISEEARVEGINLSDCKLHNLDALRNLTGLTDLNLEGNQISDLTPLSGLTGLTWLDLNDNQITDLTPLSGLTGLKWLELEGNQFTDLTPLSGLTGLRFLKLDYNEFTDLTPLSGLKLTSPSEWLTDWPF